MNEFKKHLSTLTPDWLARELKIAQRIEKDSVLWVKQEAWRKIKAILSMMS